VAEREDLRREHVTCVLSPVKFFLFFTFLYFTNNIHYLDTYSHHRSILDTSPCHPLGQPSTSNLQMPAASASASASAMAAATVAAAAGTRDATCLEPLLYGFYIYCKSFFVIFKKKTILTSTLSRLCLCMETTTTSISRSSRRGSRCDMSRAPGMVFFHFL
jgi:hypothetical protein